ncbi:MAG: DUF4325 domain-containing protein [Candidatus Levybacteria bacterium]|nr:DUF4325 domain-containing protein [Candidatus Levybacteria bacterium]
MDTRSQILKFAEQNKIFRTSDVVKGLKNKVSRQQVSHLLNDLFKRKLLVRQGSGAFIFYALPVNANLLKEFIRKKLLNENLKEHEVLDEIKQSSPFLSSLKENVDSIFNYAFSEMLNNAIEHSKSKTIEVSVESDKDILSFMVRDSGIGVFRSVMEKRHLNSELEAIQDLLKGKLTTQPQSHSGEGIFFTSKVADVFILESFNTRLRIDNLIKDVFVEEISLVKGTRVIFEIAINSKRHLNHVFREYTNPTSYAFDKTEIHIKLYTMGTIYVSRSQARRVLTNLDKFKTVILDFDQVPTIGQAFADEIFRVFAQKHPDIKISPINMNEAVDFMVRRVEKPNLTSLSV